jgi:hypothetical protein
VRREEIAVRHHLAGRHEDGGVVRGAVELDGDDALQHLQREMDRAVALDGVAERQRVLQAPGGARLQQRRLAEPAPQGRRRGGFAGLGAQGQHVFPQGGEVGAEALERQGGRHFDSV